LTVSNKIKVVFLVHTYGFGGLENMVTNLVRHLDPVRFEATILSFAPLRPLAHRLDPGDVRIVSLHKKGGNNPILVYKIFLKLLKIRPDIVQTHNWGTALEGLLGAKLAGIRGVIHAERGTLEGRRLNLLVQRLLWGLADQVLSVSQAHRKKMSQMVGLPEESIKVIPNGVDAERFSPNSGLKGPVRKKFGIKKDSLCIGTVGSLRSVKNQVLLVKACEAIFPRFKHVEALVVGEGPLKGELLQEATDKGLSERLHFVGSRTNVHEILNALDIFVLPSLSEGMPNAVLEAMACGLPVLASAVGGTPELIEDGKSGVLFPSNDLNAFVQSLEKLIQDRQTRQAFGLEGRRRVLAHFSLKEKVLAYQRLYESVLRKKACHEP